MCLLDLCDGVVASRLIHRGTEIGTEFGEGDAMKQGIVQERHFGEEV